jgi:hypothetical protein
MDQENRNQKELEVIYNAYDSNNGRQEMERNLDIVLESNPGLHHYKDYFLDVMRQAYCMGFLKGYNKN